jgi:hypothetical protein
MQRTLNEDELQRVHDVLAAKKLRQSTMPALIVLDTIRRLTARGMNAGGLPSELTSHCIFVNGCPDSVASSVISIPDEPI